jgi:putative ABC transport system permease protein
MGSFTGILRVLEGFALALALLIAINSARLAQEERRREQATMFAFGLPVRTVVWSMVVETVLVAALGTLIGLAGGYLALRWLIHTFTTDTFPELGMEVTLSTGTIVAVLVLGIGVTACAPLFSVRRLRRTDVPATLRVLE